MSNALIALADIIAQEISAHPELEEVAPSELCGMRAALKHIEIGNGHEPGRREKAYADALACAPDPADFTVQFERGGIWLLGAIHALRAELKTFDPVLAERRAALERLDRFSDELEALKIDADALGKNFDTGRVEVSIDTLALLITHTKPREVRIVFNAFGDLVDVAQVCLTAVTDPRLHQGVKKSWSAFRQAGQKGVAFLKRAADEFRGTADEREQLKRDLAEFRSILSVLDVGSKTRPGAPPNAPAPPVSEPHQDPADTPPAPPEREVALDPRPEGPARPNSAVATAQARAAILRGERPETALLSQISEISFAHTALQDLTNVSALHGLRTLSLEASQIMTLKPLSALDGLEFLDLRNTAIADLTPLAGLKRLRSLNLSNTGVTDLAPLAGLDRLQTLWLAGTLISDLSPLSELKALDRLWLRGAAVDDLRPVAHVTELFGATPTAYRTIGRDARGRAPSNRENAS